MEIRQMIYFKELSECLSVPLAAKKLYITPQALSKSMRILAQEFDTEIFFKEQGKLQLTTFGKAFQREVIALLSQIQGMENRLKNVAYQESGSLRIALSHGVLQGSFQHFFQQFQKDHPEIQLELIELPDVFAEQYVVEEECDLGFSIGLPQKPEQFNSLILQHYKVCAVVHPDHPIAQQTTTCLKECCLYPIITKNRIFKIHDTVENCARKQNLHLIYALQSSNEILWKQLVEENKGIGIGTTYYGNSGILKSIPFIEEELNWDIVLIHKKNHYLSRAAILLIDTLIERCAEN